MKMRLNQKELWFPDLTKILVKDTKKTLQTSHLQGL